MWMDRRLQWLPERISLVSTQARKSEHTDTGGSRRGSNMRRRTTSPGALKQLQGSASALLDWVRREVWSVRSRSKFGCAGWGLEPPYWREAPTDQLQCLLRRALSSLRRLSLDFSYSRLGQRVNYRAGPSAMDDDVTPFLSGYAGKGGGAGIMPFGASRFANWRCAPGDRL
jgi:hypothetical protein